MFKLEDKWRVELHKKGLQTADGKMGGGRLLLLRATNMTDQDLPRLQFTGKIKSDGIITDRIRRSFGVLEPGEVEELHLLRATGPGTASHAREHEVSIYFTTVALQFRASSMGCKFKGEIPNRTDMYTVSSFDETDVAR